MLLFGVVVSFVVVVVLDPSPVVVPLGVVAPPWLLEFVVIVVVVLELRLG